MTQPSATVPARRVPTAIPFAEPLPAPLLARPVIPTVEPVRRTLPVRMVRGLTSGMEWLFGVAVLFVGLAALATIPVLQLLSLGYLLESAARVARSGRLREAFIGVRTAARLGGIVVFAWLFLLPVRFVSDLAYSASVIDPGSRTAANWRTGLLILIGLTFAHVLLAVARDGKVRYFLWPFNFVWLIRRLLRGGYYTEARDAVWDTAVSLRLPYYFWLGVRGFAAAFVWLVLPVSLIAARQLGGPLGAVLAFVGVLQLTVVLLYLPFLQLRLAVENRFGAAFDVKAVQRAFAKAPVAFAASLMVTLLFALPLYLLKIEVVPSEAAWLPGLVFLAFIFPARVLTGWAYSRALKRTEPRHWLWRWTARVPLLPAAAFYVLVLFFTQYTSWNGVWGLYEQHAFLVPVPFFGG
jgi:hypothetical protein